MKRLFELMDNPYPYTVSEASDYIFLARFEIPDSEGVAIRYEFSSEMGAADTWDINFAIRNQGYLNKDGIASQYGRADTGNEIGVFATVAAILNRFLNQYNPKKFAFTGYEKSRVKLYDLFAHKIAKEYGYQLISSGGDDNRAYLFIDPTI